MSLKLEDIPFEEGVQKGIENDFMRQAVSGAQGRFRAGRLKQAQELGNWEDWRKLGEEIRTHTVNHIDFYLHQLSEQVEKRGGHVYFAETAEEANSYIKQVIQTKNAKKNC